MYNRYNEMIDMAVSHAANMESQEVMRHKLMITHITWSEEDKYNYSFSEVLPDMEEDALKLVGINITRYATTKAVNYINNKDTLLSEQLENNRAEIETALQI